uniref:Rho GTPase activating protein 36 n=1 Tax=Serinus canaria TaxID=9135 RepID=A0A8C9NR37_SERCA
MWPWALLECGASPAQSLFGDVLFRACTLTSILSSLWGCCCSLDRAGRCWCWGGGTGGTRRRWHRWRQPGVFSRGPLARPLCQAPALGCSPWPCRACPSWRGPVCRSWRCSSYSRGCPWGISVWTEMAPKALNPSGRSWRASRRTGKGAMSVDSITDLSDNASELLEALQLSHPNELDPRRSQGKKKLLSLNPITWQVPRIVDRCCTHLEMHGLQTVGIFRVGSSKKRVQQLREEFDRGLDVFLDEHQNVHDVAALLKEFFRDLPDSLIPRELYGAFLSTASLEGQAQLDTLQLLLFLLPPCHSDTLLRLLRFLAKVAQHAESSWDPQGRQIPGNKMTVSNLATVFGPNILQKEKPGEKDAGALNFEDSAAIILVLQRLIEHHHSLFMVSPEMQWDVLRRLFQTDPDVIEYLLRRKFPDVPSPEREDPGEELALSALPGWTHSLERGSVSLELYSNVSFLNLDVGI